MIQDSARNPTLNRDYDWEFSRQGQRSLELVKLSGSHHILRSPDGQRYASIPMHNKPLKKGTLRNILTGAKLTVDEFVKLK